MRCQCHWHWPSDEGRRHAYDTFEGLFGDVHRSWRQGRTVTGTYLAAGRRVRLTILPDGTTEEHDELAGTSGRYSSVFKLDPGRTDIPAPKLIRAHSAQQRKDNCVRDSEKKLK